MNTAEPRPAVTPAADLALPTDPDARCLVCPHPWQAHDALGMRFCTATQASSATGRGCICG